MEQLFDKLPASTLDNFHDFRNKTYGYTYLCKGCVRSFDSKTELKSCKFCNGPIIQMRKVEKVKKGITKKTRLKYHYVCPNCDAQFDSDDGIDTCHYCKTKWLHVYTWADLGKSDKFGIKMIGAVKNMINKNESHRTRIHRIFDNEQKDKVAKNKISMPNFKLPKKRTDEELPTY